MTIELVLRSDSDPQAPAQRHDLPLSDGGAAVTVGRAPDCTLPLDDSRVSRQHVSFAVQNGRLYVTDVSSTGVWINDQPALKRVATPLAPADEIRIPGYWLTASVAGLAAPPDMAATAPAAASPPPPHATPPAPPGPAWWRPDAREWWVLTVLALTALFFAAYRSL